MVLHDCIYIYIHTYIYIYTHIKRGHDGSPVDLGAPDVQTTAFITMAR